MYSWEVFKQIKLGNKPSKVNNVNARYLAHALLSECLFSSACAILSRRG